MLERLPTLLVFYPVLLFSLSCHEAAHGWMANRFGDPTAKQLGRITLNPFPHMDFIGTFLLPVVGILTHAPLIGWGKPVPVNPYNLRNPLKDSIWISAFGPISNIILALFFAGLGRLMIFGLGFVPESSVTGFAATAIPFLFAMCHIGVSLNLALAMFNMIPIPPLDGGGIVRGLLPVRYLEKFFAFERYSMFILLILLATGLLGVILAPVGYISRILLPI